MTIKQVVECDSCHQTIDHDTELFTHLHSSRPRSVSKWLQMQTSAGTKHFCSRSCAAQDLLVDEVVQA